MQNKTVNSMKNENTAKDKIFTVSDILESLNRNVDIISEVEQAHLGSAKLLVAGCGSVGGSIIEPLVRSGMRDFCLADPETYDITNLNRQACTLDDIDQKKTDVLSARILEINPNAEVRSFPEGLTEENLDNAIKGVNIIFDGIDAGAAPWVKYLMHKKACQMKIPVLAGIDFGGKAVIYVFDYRRHSVPFYGRATEKAHRDGDLVASLRWLGYSKYPSDFLPVISNRLVTKEPWPQVSYCVSAMSAIGTKTIIDVLTGKKVKHIISFDVHMSSRSFSEKVTQHINRPFNLLNAYKVSRSIKTKELDSHPVRKPYLNLNYLESNKILLYVLEVMIRSPSPHNCQPWRFIITGPDSIRISWNKDKLLNNVDPEGYAIMYSLGCAIEAAASVANIEFIPSEERDFFSDNYYVGTVVINEVNAKQYAQNRDLNFKRSTNRSSFLKCPIDKNVESNCIESASNTSTQVSFLKKPPELLKQITYQESSRLFSENGYFNELISYLRLDSIQEAKDPTGFTADSLGISLIEAKFLNLLKSSSLSLDLSSRLGLRTLMSKSTIKSMSKNDSYMLISTNDWTDEGRLEVGRVIMKTWLILTKADIACQPLDFPISSDLGRDKIKSYFGIQKSYRPILLMRLGRASRTSKVLSSRMDLNKFIEFSIGNNKKSDLS